jgi:hypothetical protein
MQDPLGLNEQRVSRSGTRAATGLSASRVIPKFDIFSEDSNTDYCEEDLPIDESFIQEYQF